MYATLLLRRGKVGGMLIPDQFAALNVAFSVASAVGAIAGGQLYDHVSWAGVVWYVLSAAPCHFSLVNS